MDNLVKRVADEAGFTSTQVELIRNTAAQDCTDEEVAQLLIMAHRTGLDPLARQIYMIKRWNNQLRRNIATPQTGIDGYRLVADRTGQYAPGRAPSFEYDESGTLFAATAYIKKLVGGEWHESSAVAFWDEYVQTTKSGDVTFMWAKMPRTMLAKCAEALALRRAFPADLSGIYTAEEMAQADTPTVQIERAALSDVIEAEHTPAPAPPAAATDSDRKAFHRAGRELYEEWDAKRPELVRAITKGEHTSSTNLTQAQMEYLTNNMLNRIDQQKAEREVESVEMDGMPLPEPAF